MIEGLKRPVIRDLPSNSSPVPPKLPDADLVRNKMVRVAANP